MKVLVAGASGMLGIPLTRALLAEGHEVIALRHTRRSSVAGVTSVNADALDRESLLRAVDGIAADAVIHELTALTKPPLRHSGMAMTNRLRIEGTANLLAAADLVGAKRFITQSIILGYGYRDHGDSLISEDDPFGVPQGDKTDPHVAAMQSTEQQAFTAPHGVALRYGMLYGGDLSIIGPLLSKRRVPVVTGGLLGWVHHEDAAAATVAALDNGRASQAYNIVDDRPASMSEVYTALADAIGAPPPLHIPAWMLRTFAPLLASIAVDSSMRVSNEKAKTELGWTPRFPIYRDAMAAIRAAR